MIIQKIYDYMFKFKCPYCKRSIKLKEGPCPYCNKTITSWDLELMLNGKLHDDQCT